MDLKSSASLAYTSGYDINVSTLIFSCDETLVAILGESGRLFTIVRKPLVFVPDYRFDKD